MSENILRFTENLTLALDGFFALQPRDLLRKIRHIEFALCTDDDFLTLANGSETAPHAWNALLGFVAANLDLLNLFVSIDARLPYDDWVGQPMRQEDLSFVLDAMATLLPSLMRLRNLRGIFIYLPVFHRLEAMMEKAVLGLEYDSAA